LRDIRSGLVAPAPFTLRCISLLSLRARVGCSREEKPRFVSTVKLKKSNLLHFLV